MFQGLKIAAVIPAYNEAACIASVVTDLLSLGRSGCEIPSAHQPLLERVVVCDNGSSDETAAVAQEAGARVVCEPQKGHTPLLAAARSNGMLKVLFKVRHKAFPVGVFNQLIMLQLYPQRLIRCQRKEIMYTWP